MEIELSNNSVDLYKDGSKSLEGIEGEIYIPTYLDKIF